MDINENEIEFIINYKLKNTAFIYVFHLPLIYRSTIRVHHMILFIGMLYILLLVSLKDIISINRLTVGYWKLSVSGTSNT